MTSVVSKLKAHHSKLLALCDNLEDVADHLPDKVDVQRCLHLARMLYPAIKSASEFEEQVIFPSLTRMSGRNDGLETSLERLRFEHWEDESYAAELSETLRAMARDRNHTNPEQLGYMLRGFFESVRRHIAFENEHIVPLFESLQSPGIGTQPA